MMVQTQKKQIYTYICRTVGDEYYCGRTINIDRRIKEHQKEKYPHWFSYKERHMIIDYIVIIGNFERDVKRAGVKRTYDILSAFKGFEVPLNTLEVSAP